MRNPHLADNIFHQYVVAFRQRPADIRLAPQQYRLENRQLRFRVALRHIPHALGDAVLAHLEQIFAIHQHRSVFGFENAVHTLEQR